jgi:hypothetical protein
LSDLTYSGNKDVRRQFLFLNLTLSFSMIGVALSLNARLLGAPGLWTSLGFVLTMVGIIPMVYMIRYYRKPDFPVPRTGWAFIWTAAFRKPYDKYLLEMALWNSMLFFLTAVVIVTTFSQLRHIAYSYPPH